MAASPAPNINNPILNIPTIMTLDNAPEVYHHSIPVQIRFNDVDRYGHVNNNSYFAYYDLGKDEYMRKVFGMDHSLGEVVPVIANINADFIAPIFHTDSIAVETRISHIGTKSFTLQQRAVNTVTHQVMCKCTTVMVCCDLRTQQSAELPQSYREAIEKFELG